AQGEHDKAEAEQDQHHEDADAGVILGPAGGARAFEGMLEAPHQARQAAREPRRAEAERREGHRAATWVGTASGAAGCAGAMAMGSGVTSMGLPEAAIGFFA